MVIDGIGSISDNTDKYYAKIRNDKRKYYTKLHITLMLILD